jgi:mannitol/fructose-specific phosphotransferase system IIA component (Ntr-type)
VHGSVILPLPRTFFKFKPALARAPGRPKPGSPNGDNPLQTIENLPRLGYNQDNEAAQTAFQGPHCPTCIQENPMNLAKKINTQDVVIYNALASTDQLYSEYSGHLKQKGHIQTEDKIKRLFIRRENVQSTAIGRGVAIPHIFSEEFQHFTIGLAVIKTGLDYKAPDNEPVHTVFLIMSDERSVGQHLKTLAYIAKLTQETDFSERMQGVETAEEALACLKEAELALN